MPPQICFARLSRTFSVGFCTQLSFFFFLIIVVIINYFKKKKKEKWKWEKKVEFMLISSRQSFLILVDLVVLVVETSWALLIFQNKKAVASKFTLQLIKRRKKNSFSLNKKNDFYFLPFSQNLRDKEFWLIVCVWIRVYNLGGR